MNHTMEKIKESHISKGLFLIQSNLPQKEGYIQLSLYNDKVKYIDKIYN